MWENVNVFSDTQSVQFAPDAYFYLLYFSRIIQSVFGISLCSKCASCDFSVQWRCVINIVQAVGSFPASTRIFPSSGNLTVVNLSPEDDGVYECVAASVVSSVITTTLLIIESTYIYDRTTPVFIFSWCRWSHLRYMYTQDVHILATCAGQDIVPSLRCLFYTKLPIFSFCFCFVFFRFVCVLFLCLSVSLAISRTLIINYRWPAAIGLVPLWQPAKYV